MTSDGSPTVRLKRALASRNLLLVRATAAELGWIGLADALAILELIEAEDEERFDAAAVRWAGRLALEAKGLSLAELADAVDALEALPAPEAKRMLLAVAEGPRGAV